MIVAPQPQGVGGYDACWYPVALAAEIGPGQRKGVDFLDNRVVVFRGASGALSVVSAYCRHLGADLSDGEVVGERLQCPFHHWSYAADGRCSAVAAGDDPPPKAQLRCFPSAESMGLIWAYNGEEPHYPVPAFSRPEAELAIRAYDAPNILPVDPIVQMLNAFDLQHFRVVHGLDLRAETYAFDGPVVDCIFRFTSPELGPMVQTRRVWGLGCVTMNGEGGRPSMAAGLMPLPRNRTRMYVVNAVEHGDGSAADKVRIDAALDSAQAYALRLIGEDWPILRDIRFRVDSLVRSDELLGRALRWAAAFPRTQPAVA